MHFFLLKRRSSTTLVRQGVRWTLENSAEVIYSENLFFFSFPSLFIRLRIKQRTTKKCIANNNINNSHRRSLKFFFVFFTRLHNVRKSTNNILESWCSFFERFCPSVASHIRADAHSVKKKSFRSTHKYVYADCINALHDSSSLRCRYANILCSSSMNTYMRHINTVVSRMSCDTWYDSRFFFSLSQSKR